MKIYKQRVAGKVDVEAVDMEFGSTKPDFWELQRKPCFGQLIEWSDKLLTD